MLPFLKARKKDQTIMTTVAEGSVPEVQDEPDAGLIGVAEDMISAIMAKDASRLAIALEAALSICSYSDEE